jgi:hypothetical protein
MPWNMTIPNFSIKRPKINQEKIYFLIKTKRQISESVKHKLIV